MQTVSRSNFTTVTTEGAILPADLLQRIADGQVDGLAPTDYHLAPNERLNEAINRSWNRLLGVWEGFDAQRQTLPDHDRGTTLTRERWLLILFDELGYGRIPYVANLEAGNTTTDDRSPLTDNRYPISHAVQHIPIHLITFRQSLDRVDDDRGAQFRRSPHSLLQEFLNRSEQSLWGIVANGLRLRLLRDNASFTRAAYLEFDLEAMFNGELYADFTLLWLVCHLSRLEIRDWRLNSEEESPVSTPQSPSECWLERWSQQAAEQGTRALDSLRDGVTKAIARLGRGFLAHPANGDLRASLQRGELDRQEYFRQLLRLVYRLIFMFVAEDRNLLLVPGTDVAVQRLYYRHYSVARLRELAAARRSGPHPDLYRGLRLLLLKLRQGYEPLGLPGLGGFLFSPRSTPALDAADIANEALLDALRELAFTIENGVRRPVDYKNLGAEELGSVYESLLELHPELNVPAATFDLRTAAGSERKTTGSYYTPTSLINSLLDTALEPVVQDRLDQVTRSQGDKVTGEDNVTLSPGHPVTPSLEEAILNIKVVDPACGSGHFLIAAANRLARHLARVRTGDGEPSPEANRQALRDVVGRCIYGVDINEMSVELCKVALWMETLDPGKPLSFLDANIQCGNSLLGATPALLARGIPDDAFTPITGDDKAYCTEWKKRNREQRTGQLDMFARGLRPWERLGNFAQAMRALEMMAGDTVADVARQQAAYERLVSSSDYEYGKLWADAWVAAFVWRKRPEGKVAADGQDGWPYPITEQVFREIERSPHTQPKWLKAEIQRLAAEYQFFHWHLAFPQVFTPQDSPAMNRRDGEDDDDVTGWAGGFDVVLGNPPWERIKLQEKEWFASRSPEIAGASNAAARRRLIDALQKNDPALYAAFQADRRRAEGESHFTRNSGYYPLMGRGDINTYQLFAELMRHVQSAAGRVGVIVPSGVATDATTQFYFQDIMDKGALASLYDFENRNAIFPGVHRSYKFCLLTLTGPARPAVTAQFVFFALDVADLRDTERRFTLNAADIALLNPNTRTCPIFRSRRDAELTKAIYRRIPVLVNQAENRKTWNISIRQGLFHMTNEVHLFRTDRQLEQIDYSLQEFAIYSSGQEQSWLPLFEGRMIHLFDHRTCSVGVSETATIRSGTSLETHLNDYLNPYYAAMPRYWVKSDLVEQRIPPEYSSKWLIGYKDVTSSTNERTMISAFLPRMAVVYSVRVAFLSDVSARVAAGFVANLNSFVTDFVTRQSVGGLHLSDHIVKQLPIIPSQYYSSEFLSYVLKRVLELTYTAYDLGTFAQDCGYFGPPFRWDEERRFLLRCELDAAYFHLYGIGREDTAYIMDTFPIVRRKDEAAHGEYRTKRVILEIYDEMAAAIVAADSNPRSSSQETRLGNRGYTTRLDPPPGHPAAAHPWDEAYLGPELPREEWWQDVEKDLTQSEDEVETAMSFSAVKESKAVYQEKSEPEVLELRHPEPSQQKKKAAKMATPSQKPLMDVMPAPIGPRSVRLKQAIALGKDPSLIATRELVAFLADEDSNIRWLASSSLLQRPSLDTVQAITTFLTYAEPARVAQARAEARKVLEMFAETAEDEAVQNEAKKHLAALQN